MPLNFWGSNGFGPEKNNPFKVLENETRKIIVTKLFKNPLTVTQLAEDLGISQPAVFGHVQILLEAGLIKDADIPQEQKKYKAEKYYIPSFPIISKKDIEIMSPICKKISEEAAEVYRLHKSELLDTLRRTSLYKAGFTFQDLWGWIRVLAFMPTLSLEKEKPPKWPSGARFYFYGEIRKEPKQESKGLYAQD